MQNPEKLNQKSSAGNTSVREILKVVKVQREQSMGGLKAKIFQPLPAIGGSRINNDRVGTVSNENVYRPPATSPTNGQEEMSEATRPVLQREKTCYDLKSLRRHNSLENSATEEATLAASASNKSGSTGTIPDMDPRVFYEDPDIDTPSESYSTSSSSNSSLQDVLPTRTK